MIRLIRILVFLVGLCAVAAYVLLYTNTPQARQLEDELRKHALGRLVLPKVPGLPDPYKRVFVTSTSYTGDLGGLAGADLKCQAAAESVGLHGTFKAWLSDKKTPAPSRLSDLGPWYSIDGTRKLFHNRKSFLASPLAPIDLNERGQRVTAGQSVWTGTAPGGLVADTCGDWTGEEKESAGTAGTVGAKDESWTRSGQFGDCSKTSLHLYCIEQ